MEHFSETGQNRAGVGPLDAVHPHYLELLVAVEGDGRWKRFRRRSTFSLVQLQYSTYLPDQVLEKRESKGGASAQRAATK